MILPLFLMLLSANVEVQLQLDNKPLVHHSVELFRFEEGTKRPETKEDQETDRNGRARFELDKKESLNFIFHSIYDGVDYFSDFMNAKALPKKPVVLKVYPAIAGHKDLKIKEARLYIDFDRQNLRVAQELIIENPTRKTIVGDKETKETLSFMGPFNAFNLQLGAGFHEDYTEFKGNEVVLKRPLLPGTSRISWGYLVDKSGSEFEFAQKFSLPVEKLSIASPIQGLKLTGINANKGAKKYYDGKIAQTYSADLAGSTALQMHLSNLPMKINYSLYLPILAFLILFGAGLIFMRLKGPEEQTQSKDKLLKELLLLRRKKQNDLIEENDYYSERLKILEELIPHYNS